MYCKYCGKEIGENAVICVGCGAATDNLFVSPAPAREKDSAPKKFPKLALIGLILSVVGGICGFFVPAFVDAFVEDVYLVLFFISVVLFYMATVSGFVLSIIGIVRSKKHKALGLSIASVAISAVFFLFSSYVTLVYVLVFAFILAL